MKMSRACLNGVVIVTASGAPPSSRFPVLKRASWKKKKPILKVILNGIIKCIMMLTVNYEKLAADKSYTLFSGDVRIP